MLHDYTQTYIVLKADGGHECKNTHGPAKLADLVEWVGGPVEFASVVLETCEHKARGHHAMMNEEGRLRNLPPNYWLPAAVGDVVLGTMLGTHFLGVHPMSPVHMWIHTEAKEIEARKN